MENKEFFAALTDLVREKGISEEAFIATLENALAIKASSLIPFSLTKSVSAAKNSLFSIVVSPVKFS